jgi:16S rRNA (cytosine967-C5)-methyltransferase
MADVKREEERLAELPKDKKISVYYSMPLWFVKAIEREYGEEETDRILPSLNEEAHTVIRANTLVSSRNELKDIFEAAGIKAAPSKLADNALILSKRINAMEYPAFRKGGFEIQDEASQLVAPMAHIESLKPRILDACAGAGGKTLHFAALAKNRGEIFATDVDARKLDETKRRTKRSSAQNVRIIYPDDRAKYLGKDKTEWFDAVLLDVPCTGTGTLRRNPSIKWNLTEEMLTALREKQRTIVNENIHFVKPGGVLLYATCSLLREESEEQVQWLLAEHPEFILEEEMRTRPDKDGCDGFYAARLRKKTT